MLATHHSILFKRHISFSKTNSFKEDYELFGLKSSATRKEIKETYYELAKQHHPDVNKKDLKKKDFKEINEAYKRLLLNCERNGQYKRINNNDVYRRQHGDHGWYGWDARQSYNSEIRIFLRRANMVYKSSFLIVILLLILKDLFHKYQLKRKRTSESF